MSSLYTEHDADAALHFLKDRYHQLSMQARWYPLQDGGLHWSPTAHNIPPSQPSAHQDALFPERGPSATARSASAGDQSDHSPSIPSLILLDLKLGGQNGCDFLIRLRSDARLAAIPVVVFTTSDDQTDLAHCYANGANGYVVKPGTFDELIHCTGDICRYWLKWNRSLLMAETRC